MVRVVLDTNVIVSAYLIPSGKPASIISLARQGRIEICLSDDIMEEIKRALVTPKLQRIHKARREEIDRFLQTFTEAVVFVSGAVEVRPVEGDPDDTKILACAVEARADYVISGDHHLTDLKSFNGIPIVKPDTFLRIMAGKL